MRCVPVKKRHGLSGLFQCCGTFEIVEKAGPHAYLPAIIRIHFVHEFDVEVDASDLGKLTANHRPDAVDAA